MTPIDLLRDILVGLVAGIASGIVVGFWMRRSMRRAELRLPKMTTDAAGLAGPSLCRECVITTVGKWANQGVTGVGEKLGELFLRGRGIPCGPDSIRVLRDSLAAAACAANVSPLPGTACSWTVQNLIDHVC